MPLTRRFDLAILPARTTSPYHIPSGQEDAVTRTVRAIPAFAPLCLLIGFLLAACGSDEERGVVGEWEGRVVQEDDATVIRTVAGSVWAGPVSLQELFTLDEEGRGPPLADVRGIAEADGRVYVLDVQEAALHIYDTAGVYLETVGRAGEGPGEFQRPLDLVLDDEGGRALVRDARLRRITVLGLDGSLITTWSTPTVPGLLRPMVLTAEGDLFLPIRLNPEDPPAAWREGMASFGPEGLGGDTIVAPEVACAVLEVSFAGTTRGSISIPVPFSPEQVWTLTRQRTMISGCSDGYRITVDLPDGDRRILQRDNWEPVPVQAREAEWHRGMLTTRIRRDDPVWTWRGPDVRDIKPAFQTFFTDPQGRLWVLRLGLGRELVDGLQEPDDPLDYFRKPRWEDTHLLDAFDPDGRFLGQVDVPTGVRFRPLPWIDGNRLLAVVEDASGELTVRAYRLLVPEL
jgi:hypothetical protein